MRLILVLLCLAAFAGLCWFAVERGLDRTGLRGAPQIQQLVDANVRAALAGVAPNVQVGTDGRHVTLTGAVGGAEAREAVLAAAGQARLLDRLSADLDVVLTVQPFTFAVEKSGGGALTVSGHVPSRVAEDAVLAAVRVAAAGGSVRSELTVAAGAPDGDWVHMATAGISALGRLVSGRFALSGLDASLEGVAPNTEAATAAMSAVREAPNARWQFDISGTVPVPDPYTLAVLKTLDGAVILDGHAPTPAVQQALTTAAQALTTKPIEGALTLAPGMPSEDWPALVQRGLNALALAEHGLLTVSNMSVALTAELATVGVMDDLGPLVDPDWEVDISIANTQPRARLQLALSEDGTLAAAGILPEGLTPDTLVDLLGEADLSGIDTNSAVAPADWTAALEAIQTVLPRLVTATIGVEGETLLISSQLRRGFSAAGSDAAVRTVMPDTWNLILDFTEAAPLAEVVLSKQGREIALSGLLPQGLAPETALDLLGPSAGGEGLATGGDGDAPAWEATLRALGPGVGFFRDFSGTIQGGSVSLNGTLEPGYEANELQDWLSGNLPEGWTFGLTAVESPPGEGDTRISLATGEPESYRSGYWLPDVEFPVSPERCAAEIEKALNQRSIQFVTASARIDRDGLALLNRLAAVAVRCLNSSVIQLEIAGHTDSVGDDQNNLRLSEQRAQAVRQALVARGVRADAMTAVGYGEERPVATNDTPEGRAQNRRIDFVWAGSER